MLPTKGYFQDIECPYFHSLCGRPYCHFRHRKKLTENLDDIVNEFEKVAAIPTYKPTPKSELANIQNSKSHIPISYVPDFTTNRKTRPLPKFNKPTYKPTPLSILSSASKRGISGENGEHIEAIKEIKQNIANVEYNPAISLQSTKDIDFEDLSTEFDLIDEIINSTEKIQKDTVENDENTKEQQSNNTTIKDEKIESNIENKDTLEQNADKCKAITPISEKTETQEKSSNKKEAKSEKSNEKYTKTEKDIEKSGKVDKHKRNKPESSVKSEKSRTVKESSVKEKRSDVKEQSGSKEKTKSSSEKSHKSSSRDKHHKEEKRRKDEKYSHHKTKHRDRSKSRSRSKEKSRHKSSTREKERKSDRDKKQEKDRHKSRSKDKHRDKERSSKKASDDRKEEQKTYVGESSENDEISLNNDDVSNNFCDLDLEDEDETMLECYKIFNEYKPPKKSAVEQPPENKHIERDTPDTKDGGDSFSGKKRIAHSNIETTTTYSQLHPPIKPKTVTTPGQILANRYKIAKLAQASREQECIMNEVKQAPLSTKRAAPTLLEAAREHKLRKLHTQTQNTGAACLVDDILKGVSKPTTPAKIAVKKIAPAQNVLLMEKAKERISKIKQTTQIKTIAQTQKGSRVAHIPENSLSDIPDVLQADKSKLPVNVRTRFLTMIADECMKLYISKQEAFTRALNEEFSCYEKCKVLATYRNSAMLAVNRLRKEVQERDKLGLGLIGLGESSSKDPSSEFKGKNFYNKVKKWVLTEEELDIHGYPRESEEHYGRAVIKNRKSAGISNLDENQRYCVRCHKIYQVDDDGWPLFEEECLYHPLKKRTIRGEQTYLCCRSNDDMGCATSDTHVSEGTDETDLEGYQKTMDPESEVDPRSFVVYALDCEMCYTTKGLELTRVTIIDTDCKTVYESLVKPLNPIIDYNTRFSGITKEQMDKTSTSILQIQANILHLCNSKTILVGHSLESDMKALKIVHGTIIDTSVLFPHKMGLPHKRALKALASEYLRKIIQNDISGHDSAEDAVTCMELIKWKLKEEMKARGGK